MPSGVEYDGDKIEAIYHAEGRAIPMYNPVITGLIDSFRYEYVLRDHLGNSRIYFSDINEDSKIQVGGIGNEVMQENHYYPFGLNHEGPFQPQQPITNQYQYNGKELNEEFGLGWNDYGHRFYDPAIGRFPSVDAFAEKYYSMTPYQYGANNPIKYIDVMGDSIAPPKDGDLSPGNIAQGFAYAFGQKLPNALGLPSVDEWGVSGKEAEETKGGFEVNSDAKEGEQIGTLDKNPDAEFVEGYPQGSKYEETSERIEAKLYSEEYGVVNQGQVDEQTGSHHVTTSDNGDTLKFESTRLGQPSFNRVVHRKKGIISAMQSRDSVEVIYK